MGQMMQKKVTEEGEKEKDLYEKFMCYCKNGAGDLKTSIADNEAKVGQLPEDIKAKEAEKTKTEEDLKTARTNLAAEKAEADSNLFAINGRCSKQKPGGEYTPEECSKVGGNFVGALPALEKGMAGAFLQTNAADALKRMLMKASDMDGKDDVLAFLSGGTNYAPQSGQIVGILKQMADTMAANLAAATADEEKAIATYTELMDAKTKEANALQASIETKIKKIGDLSVAIVEMKNDLSETEAALLEDQK